MYQVEIVWNREFHFVNFGNFKDTLEEAIKYAEDIYNSGDGTRVKKRRVRNLKTDEIAWDGYTNFEKKEVDPYLQTR